MKNTSPEESLYGQVSRFVAKTLNCWEVKQQVGTRHGKIDVVGLREIHGDFMSTPELVGVEVKEERCTFLSSLGQAVGYSVFAHQCYLAVKKRRFNAFSADEIRLASRLGVGLIEVRSQSCSIVRSSCLFEPEPRYVAHLLKKMGFFQCALCAATYKHADVTELSNHQIDLSEKIKYRGNLRKAILKGKNLSYYLFQLAQERRGEDRGYVYDRRFLCRDCISLFASLMPK